MAQVRIATEARDDLTDLIRAHGLPASARDRVRRSIDPLAEFPLLGPALEGRWLGFRFVLGPWPWLLIVYGYDPEVDAVFVVAFEDARSGGATRSTR